MKTQMRITKWLAGTIGCLAPIVAIAAVEPYVPDVGVGVTQREFANMESLEPLPPLARVTVEKIAGRDRILDIKTQTRNGLTVYRIELQPKPGFEVQPSLVVSQDGSVVQESHLGAAATDTDRGFEPSSNR
jgi:hypothetical protein